MSAVGASGYRGILKSTVLVGGASVVGLGLGMIRGKFIAVQLGAQGTGIFGNLNSLLPLLATLLSCGLAQSAVKVVAADHAGPPRGAATVYALTPWLALGASLVVFLGSLLAGHSRIWGKATPWDLYWLSIGVGLAVLAAGWGGILQGRQALASMSKASIVAALITTGIALPCIRWWGTASVAVVVVLGSASAAAAYGWLLRSFPKEARGISLDRAAARTLLSLGLVLAAGLILSQGSSYFTRWMVTHEGGLEGAGWYQAAVTLAATMPSFALNAMGASLYPQLVAAPDRHAAHELVNRQMQIALLVTGPALLWLCTLPTPVLHLLYSSRGFQPAVDLVGWIVLGTFARLITWPIGYLLLARSAGRIYLITEAAAAGLLLVFTWVCIRSAGLLGSGIAYGAAYGVYTVLILIVGGYVHGFRLDGRSWRWVGLIGISVLLAQFVFARRSAELPWLLGGIFVAIAVSLWAARALWQLTRHPQPVAAAHQVDSTGSAN